MVCLWLWRDQRLPITKRALWPVPSGFREACGPRSQLMPTDAAGALKARRSRFFDVTTAKTSTSHEPHLRSLRWQPRAWLVFRNARLAASRVGSAKANRNRRAFRSSLARYRYAFRTLSRKRPRRKSSAVLPENPRTFDDDFRNSVRTPSWIRDGDSAGQALREPAAILSRSRRGVRGSAIRRRGRCRRCEHLGPRRPIAAAKARRPFDRFSGHLTAAAPGHEKSPRLRGSRRRRAVRPAPCRLDSRRSTEKQMRSVDTAPNPALQLTGGSVAVLPPPAAAECQHRWTDEKAPGLGAFGDQESARSTAASAWSVVLSYKGSGLSFCSRSMPISVHPRITPSTPSLSRA
jgi:hypothetical protein